MEKYSESFRASSSRFEKEFGAYLVSRMNDHGRPERCTFFRDDKGSRTWATCLFER